MAFHVRHFSNIYFVCQAQCQFLYHLTKNNFGSQTEIWAVKFEVVFPQ